MRISKLPAGGTGADTINPGGSGSLNEAMRCRYKFGGAGLELADGRSIEEQPDQRTLNMRVKQKLSFEFMVIFGWSLAFPKPAWLYPLLDATFWGILRDG